MQTKIVYSPIISLGGQLTSMHKQKPTGIFKVWRIHWDTCTRPWLLRHLAGK